MRIGIDVRKIRDSGIGTYIYNLLKNILEIDRENEYFLFFAEDDHRDFEFNNENVNKIVEHSDKYSIMEHINLSIKSYKLKLNLFHTPHYVLPLSIQCDSIVTVHDIIHLLFPKSIFHFYYAKYMISNACRRAKKIITVSNNTKMDLIRHFYINDNKIKVIYNGVDNDFHPIEEKKIINKFLMDKGLPSKYLLCVTGPKLHKNVISLIKAFSLIKDKIDCSLIICGDDSENTRKAIKGMRDRIFLIKYLKKEELIILYNGAIALIFPSLYEGFGFPPLEAMACGIPVLSSINSSLPEVLGDAGLYFDPYNIDQIAENIINILGNRGLYEDLKEKGRKRAKIFSWEKTAEETLMVYREVLNI
jgi:glycosyltransferase involved in cell wall biosynthesis